MEPTETVYQNFRYFGFVVFADFRFHECSSFIHTLECLGNVVFGIPHEHFFDFGAEFFFSGAEFLGSPLNGAE